MGRDNDADDSDASEGAAAGGVLAIPGVGPVVDGLRATLAGDAAGAAADGVAGGLIGALTDDGVSEDDAHVYAEGVRRGGTLVTVRVEDDLAPTARAILSSGSVDITRRRDMYAEEGWSRFDEGRPDYTADEIEAERRRLQDLR